MNLFSKSLSVLAIVFIVSCSKDDPTPATTVTDKDGNVYETVTIGEQVWMAENLRTTQYNDGTPITAIINLNEWATQSAGAFTSYANAEGNMDAFGALYNWYAVNSNKLCPTGWHMPSSVEWKEMENYLIANGYNFDGSTDGDKTSTSKVAKALATSSGWSNSTVPGSVGNSDYPEYQNKSGFSALPGGYRYHDGTFNYAVFTGYWWTTSGQFTGGSLGLGEVSISSATLTAIYNNGLAIGYHNVNPRIGASCRCVKD
ncbi:fibrobacter succinogenes major paralogous domain-containing protein [Chryseotalea sanaruensis]|nr:fibrobacter succinogenes major paralogous domain-containing protein [Chryseotalea sanaruensis]